MSCVYKGEVIETQLSAKSKGGTEQMRTRLVENANPKLLKEVAVHFSRPREIYQEVPNILYCHDLAEDPENVILENGQWEEYFDFFVFVSCWQRDQYINKFKIPYSKCAVIHNAIEKEPNNKQKPSDKIRFIYHTTPHRGLEILVPVFEALCDSFDNIELDVYSSFQIYGWEQRDEAYQQTFERIKQHPRMNYHGTVSNKEILRALDNSHIFLYPNIWKETSCLALIEAINSGLICIHPNYGALPEVSENSTIMYDYNEDPTTHANYVYTLTDNLLRMINAEPDFFEKFARTSQTNMVKNRINTFQTKWNQILEYVLKKN